MDINIFATTGISFKTAMPKSKINIIDSLKKYINSVLIFDAEKANINSKIIHTINIENDIVNIG